MKSRILFSVFLVSVSLFSISLAQVPRMINYQGKLMNADEALIDDTLSMIFAIYTDSIGVDSLWSERQDSVIVRNGVFSVLLGSVNEIPDSVFDGGVRYLGIRVGADSEMNPRKAIVSVGYAYNADMLDGMKASAIMPKPTGDAQGDILIRDASGWSRLPAGNPGEYLKTQGSGANPQWEEFNLDASGNVVFMFGSGWDYGSPGGALGEEWGLYSEDGTLVHTHLFWKAQHTAGNYRTILRAKFKKTSLISTITVYAYWYAKGGCTTADKRWNRLRVDVGGQGNYVEHLTWNVYSWGPDWENFDVDISSLTNGTVYDVQIQLQGEGNPGATCYASPELYYIMGIAN